MKKKIIKNKSAFTLIEIIVVLVIIGILIALAAPAVLGYVKKAEEVKDELKINALNKGSQAYRVVLYGKEKLDDKDIFAGTTSDEERQELLIEHDFLDEFMKPIKDSDEFTWDKKQQLWMLNGDDGNTAKLNGTIMDQKVAGDGKVDRGTKWDRDEKYKKGDFITINGITYRWTGEDDGNSSRSPSETSNTYQDRRWKEIKLEYDQYTLYEKGDVVQYGGESGKYYKALKDPDYGYQSAGCSDGYCIGTSFQPDYALNKSGYFIEVELVNGKWQEVKK